MTLIAKSTSTSTTTLVEFNTVLGALVRVADRDAIKSVAAKYGDNWKKGWTGNAGLTKSATEELEQKSVPLFDKIEGALASVRYDEGTDGKTVYRKVRIDIVGNDGKVTLTLPLDGDTASRLVPKLAAVAPGEFVKIGVWMGWSEPRADGVRYANAAASVKTNVGEVKASAAVIESLKAAAAQVKAATAALNLDAQTVRKASRSATEKVLMALVKEQIQPQYAPTADAASPADAQQPEHIRY